MDVRVTVLGFVGCRVSRIKSKEEPRKATDCWTVSPLLYLCLKLPEAVTPKPLSAGPILSKANLSSLSSRGHTCMLYEFTQWGPSTSSDAGMGREVPQPNAESRRKASEQCTRKDLTKDHPPSFVVGSWTRAVAKQHHILLQ